jgi:hypothetical protein
MREQASWGKVLLRPLEGRFATAEKCPCQGGEENLENSTPPNGSLPQGMCRPHPASTHAIAPQPHAWPMRSPRLDGQFNADSSPIL